MQYIHNFLEFKWDLTYISIILVPSSKVRNKKQVKLKTILFFFISFLLLFSVNPPPEATLRGTEYITYDLQQKSLEPILSINDEISLYFKTRKSSGLLFYTGEIFKILYTTTYCTTYTVLYVRTSKFWRILCVNLIYLAKLKKKVYWCGFFSQNLKTSMSAFRRFFWFKPNKIDLS